jgi:hypothetical protein
MEISRCATYSKQTIYPISVPRAGLEPARPFGPEDFPTTIAFATCPPFGALSGLTVCGLDDAFSVHVSLPALLNR